MRPAIDSAVHCAYFRFQTALWQWFGVGHHASRPRRPRTSERRYFKPLHPDDSNRRWPVRGGLLQHSNWVCIHTQKSAIYTGPQSSLENHQHLILLLNNVATDNAPNSFTNGSYHLPYNQPRDHSQSGLLRSFSRRGPYFSVSTLLGRLLSHIFRRYRTPPRSSQRRHQFPGVG